MELSEAIDRGIEKLAELNFEDNPLGYMRDDIYRKPASHRQVCYVCYGELQKGDLIRKGICGATQGGYLQYDYAHLDCFLAMLFHTILGMKG